jgi:pyruvate/2-oxoglutarate dehydrogenase complex dihydrolipoamide acyltransferase (E2) component
MPVIIPKLGIAMTEGTLQEWLVSDGATVTAGAPCYILETDKVETEIDVPTDGTIRLIGHAGAVYPVGALIAEIEPSNGAPPA